MKKLLLILVVGYGVWTYYLKPMNNPVITNIASDGSVLSEPVVEPAPFDTLTSVFEQDTSPAPAATASTSFHCDGRQYCSQMTSCEEAMYFLQHCPGVKMDGGEGRNEPDGVPCERQWCN